MSSQADLGALKALLRSDPVVEEGLDEYCVLVADADDFAPWVDAAPRVGEPFARDGSEHEFCLLPNGAVLLYTPLSDDPYVVVGADLREFLGLLLHGNGAQVGGLAYDRDETAEELADGPDADEELSSSEQAALDRLTDVFGLVRWSDPRARLVELQALLPT
ncbi:hypothetical protein [Nocardioides sp. AX2bis]|uniref:hypothetical protein n=1 Tax=Nocardioides sp. AX2bis TaxID=2653157 RepID=UPI0012F28A58|nr:hypothetical protein [Nocardioides sp. AX2bis]VXB76623.1 conserved hypothetical protein [Nocardioides sp. AX2bis]